MHFDVSPKFFLIRHSVNWKNIKRGIQSLSLKIFPSGFPKKFPAVFKKVIRKSIKTTTTITVNYKIYQSKTHSISVGILDEWVFYVFILQYETLNLLPEGSSCYSELNTWDGSVTALLPCIIEACSQIDCRVSTIVWSTTPLAKSPHHLKWHDNKSHTAQLTCESWPWYLQSNKVDLQSALHFYKNLFEPIQYTFYE